MAASLQNVFRHQPRSHTRMWAQVLAFEFSPFDCAQVRVKVTDYGLALICGPATRGAVTRSNNVARPVVARSGGAAVASLLGGVGRVGFRGDALGSVE
jgi:hypothetical protein